MKSVSKFLLFASPVLLGACGEKSIQQDKKNVLFICIDDFRPEVGAYGHSQALTPNMDALAAEGSLFYNHYVQVPTSGASRGSILTGRLPRLRPDADNGAAEFRITGRPETETPETFFHHLRRNGYYTVGIGKISHSADGYVYGYNHAVSDKLELPHSWDEMLFDYGKWGTGWNAFFGYSDGSNRQSKKSNVKPYECGDVDDEGYPDGLTAKLAVKKLNELASKKQPFCLAVGFFKPHLPFVSPKKYWDKYCEDTLTLPEVAYIPENLNPTTLHNSSEFKSYRAGDEKPSLDHKVSDAYARKLRHAYLSAVSFTDAQVGKVLDELKRLGLDKNTIVVLWGDHGWHLGEMNVWGKHTVLETAVNSTLIVKAPGRKSGVKNHRVVSSVDIYPTLMELCDVKTTHKLDGHSFVSLLDNPEDKNWEDAAYSYWKDAISVRTPEYRYTYHFNNAEPKEELFEYSSGRYETKNIAAEHPEILQQLRPVWEKGNTGIFKEQQQVNK